MQALSITFVLLNGETAYITFEEEEHYQSLFECYLDGKPDLEIEGCYGECEYKGHKLLTLNRSQIIGIKKHEMKLKKLYSSED